MTALDVLGWAVLHSVWQAVVVAGALAVFLRTGGASSRVRYAAVLSALFAVASSFAGTVAVLGTAGGAAGESAHGLSASGFAGLEAARPLFLAHTAIAPVATWVGIVWLSGATLLLVRWLGGWWLAARVTLRAAGPARAAWEQSLGVVAARMGVRSPVTLLESPSVDTPLLVGYRRPVVVLPVPAFETLAPTEAESVLAHELAHVRRGDFLANVAQGVVEILFFFHPAVLWLSRTARDLREECCDDLAVQASGSRVVYARALAQLEALRSSIPPARLALGANGGTLLRRIERLAAAEPPAPRPTRPSVVLLLSAAATLACVATIGRFMLPPTLYALAAPRQVAERYTVHARDPAGQFSVTFDRGRPTGAVVGGVPIAAERLVTRGDSLFLPAGPRNEGYFAVRLKPGGFTWTPRGRSP